MPPLTATPPSGTMQSSGAGETPPQMGIPNIGFGTITGGRSQVEAPSLKRVRQRCVGCFGKAAVSEAPSVVMAHSVLNSLDIAMSPFASFSYFVPPDILACLGRELERCSLRYILRLRHDTLMVPSIGAARVASPYVSLPMPGAGLSYPGDLCWAPVERNCLGLNCWYILI